MNKRQVITLWGIAAVLALAVGAVKIAQNQSAQNVTKRVQGQTLFESFPASDAVSVEIQGADGTVTLTKKDQKWQVGQRDQYPANNTFVNDLIRTLSEIKVTQGMEAGPSFAPRFGMDESAKDAKDRGLTLSFKNSAGAEIAKVSLGKNIESGSAPAGMMGMGGSNAVGRYIRNHADESGFYGVSEIFPSVSDDPKRWLSDAFISPEKINSITVSQVGKAEPSWKVSRESETAEFSLANPPAGKVLDSNAAAPLKTLFSYARFDDVVPSAEVAKRAAEEGKKTAVIETVDGFTYTLQLSPTKPAATETPSPDAANPSSDAYLLTVEVAAEIPSERKKEADEKPEDAKTKDAAFAESRKALLDKLAKEKSFAGITFEVAKTLVEPLLKEIDTMVTDAAAPPAADANAGTLQQHPGGIIASPPVSATTPPISATTPPISIPASEPEE
jgi:hypothetical protein